MPPIDPHDDLLPEEKALLEGRAIDSEPPAAEPAAAPPADDGEALAALSAEALAAIAAKAEAPAEAPAPTEAAATPAEAPAEPPAAPAPPSYNVADPAKFDETRQALLTKKAEAMKGLMDGTIEVDAFMAVDNEVTQGLQDLTKNVTLHEANVQAEANRQRSVLDSIRADAAKVGIDYSDPDVGGLFDSKMRTIAAAPENAGKSVDEIFALTNTAVLKLFGKGGAAAPPPAPTPAPTAAAPTPAAPAPKPTIPPTLGLMPNAAPVDVGQDLTNTIMAMDDPDQAEAMMAKMPAAQRQSALRATLPNTPQRRGH